MEAIAEPSLADGRGDQRPLPRRRPGAGDHLRPADLRRRREARDAAGQARADLRPHRPAQVPRHGRAGADQGAVPHRAQLRGRAGRARSASSTKWSTTSALEEASVELAAAIAANAPLSMRGNKQRDRTAQPAPGAHRAAGGGPDRPARVLLRLRGLPRGDPRLRREAQARVDRAGERAKSAAPRWPPPTRRWRR